MSKLQRMLIAIVVIATSSLSSVTFAQEPSSVDEATVELSQLLADGDDAGFQNAAARILADDDLLTEDPEGYITLLIALGDQQLAVENNDEALAAYARADDLITRIHGEMSVKRRGSLTGQAKAYAALEEFDDAVAAAETSLRIARHHLGDDSPALRDELEILAQITMGPRGALFFDSSDHEAQLLGLTERASDLRSNITVLGGSSVEVDSCSDDAEFQRVEVFYATNRVRTGQVSPRSYYGLQYEADGLKYGSAYVSVPCDRALGSIPTNRVFGLAYRPTDRGRHLVLEDVVEADSAEDYWSEIQETNGKFEGESETFVFIHGFNVSFEGAALRTAQLAVDFELQGAPMFYDWASRGNPLAYARDRDLATGFDLQEELAAFLQDVAEKSGADRVHVIAHSLGNEVLIRALRELAASQDEPLFDQMVFAAPDIKTQDFVRSMNDAATLARGLTLYASDRDKALFYSGVRQFPRAGDANQAVVADGLDSIDTSLASSNFLGHSDFAGNGLDDLRSVIWFGVDPDQRCVLQEGSHRQRQGIWVFEPQCDETVFRAAIVSLRRTSRDAALALADRQISLISRSTREDRQEQLQRWRDVRAQIDVLSSAASN